MTDTPTPTDTAPDGPESAQDALEGAGRPQDGSGAPRGAAEGFGGHGHTVDLITNARARLLTWARTTIIAEDPDLSARHQHALDQLEDEDPAVSRAALGEISAVLETATVIAGGQPLRRQPAHDGPTVVEIAPDLERLTRAFQAVQQVLRRFTWTPNAGEWVDTNGDPVQPPERPRPAPPRRDGRPAWQSPYGPPQPRR